MKKIIIAIDGPSASGKTTTAKLLAEKLGYVYIDTGAMYRAVALSWLFTKKELSENVLDEILKHIKIELKPSPNGQITILNNEDISEEIRSIEVNQCVSPISAMENVRAYLVNLQRQLGSQKACVMDGRDIGTIVFPEAELKIYQFASIGARAKRRLLEYKAKGLEDLSFDEIAEQIDSRDKFDSNRKHSPLQKAVDAIELDTSNMTLQQQVDYIYNLAIEKING